jgi:WD40 repeat protein
MHSVISADTVPTCTRCGTPLRSAPGTDGLCPQCLTLLDLTTAPTGEQSSASRPVGHALSGLIGERYEIREMLGRGGMGDVYRAFDLKLRVDVALKTVRAEDVRDEPARALIRREVRAAREVISPNVCRIFDLVDQNGLELLSMEYIDGTTLRDVLRTRGPLPLSEAREIASQFLSGLEAIHQAGLVHRDVKPENVMISRTGRVVVMDFGIAKGTSEQPSRLVSGTPAYMAPEQARGADVDARADVFSAGLVLAEMVSVGGPESRTALEAFWRGVRETPPQIPEGPWAPVLQRALACDPEARFPAIRALAHALEQVTSRLPGAEDTHPYPGLAPFTQEAAPYFFGREAEVEAVWTKLARPRLLGIIGASGAGKSSFLRAGLLPPLPASWRAAIATPGPRPFQALARALASSCPDDPDLRQALERSEDSHTILAVAARWRSRHAHVLIIVDQFEELFTHNPADVQAAFAQLLGRLVLDADAHVIVAMRDDFLARCHGHEALAPLLSDLTLLGPLDESGLRRALVQPALACGYRFEDETLVDAMVQTVLNERGALPLLAFAASRLWDKRDGERGLLTWAAYRDIGGVEGALAQHAEATLERIGEDRIPIVREIFRNLVSAQGTRAVRERDELLSVFDPSGADTRTAAETVLDALVVARLVTAYEEREHESVRRQRIEIIHESLLTAWPRLVRWQTQDADSAQLRDQLRQAAQAWEERGRPADLLWSGSVYRDLELWRERYPGGLSATEEAFTAAARRRNERARRRRRVAVAALLTFAALIAITTSMLWSRSEASRRQAEAQTQRAEAGKLLAIAERELARDSTAALAYVIRSLEMVDSDVARLFVPRVLQRAPVGRVWKMTSEFGSVGVPAFSPDGQWFAAGGFLKVAVVGRDGQNAMMLGDYPSSGEVIIAVRFGPDGDVLAASRAGDVRAWTIPGGRELRRGAVETGISQFLFFTQPDAFITLTGDGERWTLRSWPLGSGETQLLGTLEHGTNLIPDDSGRRLFYEPPGRGGVYLRSLIDWNASPRRISDDPPDQLSLYHSLALALSPDEAWLARSDHTAQVRLSRVLPPLTMRERVLRAPTPVGHLGYDPTGQWLFADDLDGAGGTKFVFDLMAPADAEPLVLARGQAEANSRLPVVFDPAGRWAATVEWDQVVFWPLDMPRAHVLRVPVPSCKAVFFSPDGRSLLWLGLDDLTRAVPLRGDLGDTRTVLKGPPVGAVEGVSYVTMHASSRVLAMSGVEGRIAVVPLDGGPARALVGFPRETTLVSEPAFSDDGRLVAAGMSWSGPRDQKVIRVWDLDTGAVRAYGPMPGADDEWGGAIPGVWFTGRDRMLAAVSGTGLVSVDLSSGATRVLARLPRIWRAMPSHDRRTVVARVAVEKQHRGPAFLIDLAKGTTVPLRTHGEQVLEVAFDPSGTVVATGSSDGTVRVGRVSGEEPHILLGQAGWIRSLAFSPDGRWLAAAGDSPKIHIWPVPDVTKVPLHRRPVDALLAVLRTHTNLRAVPDSASPGGYALKPDPFPGWAKLPEWW